jgi:tetratricopeptide (TPR) repeat protein
MQNRGNEIKANSVISLDEEKRRKMVLIQDLQARRNQISKEVPEIKKVGGDANQLLERSLALDNKYADTTLRQANVLRATGEYTKAVSIYTPLIVKNPRVLDSQITTIIRQLATQPDLLAQIRDAYNTNLKASDALSISIIGLLSSQLNDHDNAILAFGKLAQMQPDSLEAQQNYTLVLSDGQRYADATIQAEKLASLAKTKGVSQDNLTLYTQLIDYFKAKAGN